MIHTFVCNDVRSIQYQSRLIPITNIITTINNSNITVHQFILNFLNNRSITKNRIAGTRLSTLNTEPKRQCNIKDAISRVYVDVKILFVNQSLIKDEIRPYVNTNIMFM